MSAYGCWRRCPLWTTQQNITKFKERATMGRVGGFSTTRHTVHGRRMINPHAYVVLVYVRTFDPPSLPRYHYDADMTIAH